MLSTLVQQGLGPGTELGIACLPVHPCSDAGYAIYPYLIGCPVGLGEGVCFVSTNFFGSWKSETTEGVVDCAPASLSRASSSLTHTRRMDGFCNQNADQLGSLAGLSFPAVYVGVVECAPAFLPRVILPHTYTQDGWFLQPERRPARLPRRTILSRCICRCSRMRARLPLHILLLHTQVSR